MKKPKTTAIVLRVRVPKNWSPAHTRNEIAQAWWGDVYAQGPDGSGEVVLKPRWGPANVVRPKP